MQKFISRFIASTIVLAATTAFADDFSSTITDGSTITAQRGSACGGTTDVYNVALPAGCSGTIDPGTGAITITSCTFAPSNQLAGFTVTLSANSGSGSYDGTTLTLVPDINVNVMDNPPTGLSCDSDSAISPTLSGAVGTSGTITFSGSTPGPHFPSSATCPAFVAGALNCTLETVTAASLNVTIP